MALPPWSVELLRRSLVDVAKKASEPDTIQRLKNQATELLSELPESAARSIDRVMRTAESGKESLKKWSRKHTALAVPVINASGILVHDDGSGVPISDEALAVGLEVTRGDSIVGEAFRDRLERRFDRLVSADRAMVVVSSFDAAVSALSLLSNEFTLVVHRHHAVRLPGGTPLPDAIDGMLPLVKQVGASDSLKLEDFDGLGPCAIVQADVGGQPIEAISTNSASVTQVAVLPFATIEPVQWPHGGPAVPAAKQLLDSGFDLVVMSGEFLCGGPRCGMIVGKKSLIEMLKSASSWDAFAASDAVQAMMLVTLESELSTADVVPVRVLLSTSEDNLRSRAERMATRLSSLDSIESCYVRAEPATLCSGGRWKVASRQIHVRFRDRSADSLVASLRDDIPAIWTRALDGELVIDLRWVDPANDSQIARAFTDGMSPLESEATD